MIARAWLLVSDPLAWNHNRGCDDRQVRAIRPLLRSGAAVLIPGWTGGTR
jgi:hypothetical protein